MALNLTATISETLLDLLAAVPSSTEPRAPDAAMRGKALTLHAARKAALYSAGLAIPPGPAAFATVLPDLLAVWRVQQQLVADVAAAYGNEGQLRTEHMLWCLFRHVGAQSVADLVVRTDNQIVVRRVAREAMRKSLRAIGVRVTQRVVGKATSRWVPLLGSAIAGGFAYSDTKRVGETAVELFAGQVPAVSAPVPVPVKAPVAAAEPDTVTAAFLAAVPDAVSAPMTAAVPDAAPTATPANGTIGAAQCSDSRYVYADFGHDGALVAAGSSRGPWRFRTWEQFRWIDHGTGEVSLQALHTDAYVRVDADGQLRADAVVLPDATRLYAVRDADSRHAFHTPDGRFVVIAAEDPPVLRLSGTDVTLAARFRLEAIGQ